MKMGVVVARGSRGSTLGTFHSWQLVIGRANDGATQIDPGDGKSSMLSRVWVRVRYNIASVSLNMDQELGCLADGSPREFLE